MGFLGLLAGLFGLDLFIKGKIEDQEPERFPRDMEGTGGKIRLYRNHNEGFCFGLLKNNPKLVQRVPLVFTSASAGILLWLLSRKGRFVDRLGFTLVTAGAFSNLYDRLKRGYVIDYFSFNVKWLKKVVFNIGDICIFAGAILLTLSDFLRSDSQKLANLAEKPEHKGKKNRLLQEKGEQTKA